MKLLLENRLLFAATLLFVGGFQTLGQSVLTGTLLTDGAVAVGVSVLVDGTESIATTQMNGEFTIEKPGEQDFALIINPCCTCFVPVKIPVSENAVTIEIDCKCKKSKVVVVQELRVGNEVLERKDKIKIRS